MIFLIEIILFQLARVRVRVRVRENIKFHRVLSAAELHFIMFELTGACIYSYMLGIFKVFN